jgi:hypothetical protein
VGVFYRSLEGLDEGLTTDWEPSSQA